ncbi:hypothetical protein FRC07_008920, partial [Ceratobasidium sp. 392]
QPDASDAKDAEDALHATQSDRDAVIAPSATSSADIRTPRLNRETATDTVTNKATNKVASKAAPINHPAQPPAQPLAQPAAQQLGAINAISEQVVNQLLDAKAFQKVIIARVEATIAACNQQRVEQEQQRADQDHGRHCDADDPTAANATNKGAQEVAEVRADPHAGANPRAGADPRAGAVPHAKEAAAVDVAATIATAPKGETIHPTAIAAGHCATPIHLRTPHLRTNLAH